jgi:hypothetical protein
VGGGVFDVLYEPTDLSPDSWEKFSLSPRPTPFFFFPKVVPFKNPARKKFEKY